jgi:cytidylate kinase
MIITIDGPSGTGKSTVARLLAKKLGFSFFDTGAMYRALSWWIQQEKIDMQDLKELTSRLKDFQFSIQELGEEKRYFVHDVDVTEEIRKKEINEVVSKISAIKEIRELLLPIQREYAKTHDSVFEGRDLGTVVFPEADVKFFLTASPEVRGKRRYLELLSKNPNSSIQLEEVIQSLQKRDEQDSSREIAPLKCPLDAWILDTSEYPVDQVIGMLLQYTLTKKK